jgi:hypothetical protein
MPQFTQQFSLVAQTSGGAPNPVSNLILSGARSNQLQFTFTPPNQTGSFTYDVDLTTVSTLPSDPTTPVYVSSTNTSLTFSWTVDPTFTYTSFLVFYLHEGVDPGPIQWTGTSATQVNASTWQITISGLTVGLYGVAVAANTATFQTGFGQAILSTGGLPLTVAGVGNISTATSTTFSPRWNISINATAYGIAVGPTSAGPFFPPSSVIGPFTDGNVFWCTLRGLTPNTNNFVRITPINNAGTGAFTVSGGIATPAAIAGTEEVVWLGRVLEVKAVGTTAHTAVYYDVRHYSSTDGVAYGNDMLARVEGLYSSMKSLFLGHEMNNLAGSITSINPTGLLENLYITNAPNPPDGNIMVGHQNCNNADIMCADQSVAATVQRLKDFHIATYVAEGDEVFMPNFASMPDCDLNGLGEGLSLVLIDVLSAQCGGITAADGACLRTYLDPAQGNRTDWINNNPATTTAAACCYVVFFHYLETQLGFN